jgi:hypothetical protein
MCILEITASGCIHTSGADRKYSGLVMLPAIVLATCPPVTAVSEKLPAASLLLAAPTKNTKQQSQAVHCDQQQSSHANMQGRAAKELRTIQVNLATIHLQQAIAKRFLPSVIAPTNSKIAAITHACSSI